MVRMTVQRKMFFGLLSVVIVFVIAINVIVQTLLRDIAEREILIELENAVVAYGRFDEQRQELLVTRALAFAQTAHLAATLAIPDVDAETIRVAGQYLEGVSNLELLLILSDTGELMADVNQIGVSTVDSGFRGGIQRALAGEPYVGVSRIDTGLYQLAIVPVISNSQMRGLLAAGQRIDDDAAVRLAEDVSGTNVTWSHKLAVTYLSTSLDEGGSLPDTVRNNDNLRFQKTISYPSLPAELVFHQELDLAASGVAAVRRFVLVCSGIIILLGMALCFRIASRISRPIVRLTEVTTNFGQGDFGIRLAPESEDEVGALTKAFNAMAEEIVEKRQDLLDSLDAAEAANRAKSEFLTRMSHEIRTPMNGVLGMAELLLTSGISDEQREYALTILDCSDGLMTIINDVLDFSEIETGKLELSTTQFSPFEAVAETAEMLSHNAKVKGLQLTVASRHAEDFWVYGDILRFKQILMNLVGNAVKFTQFGQIRIRATVVDDAEDDITLRVEVADTGIGIHAADLKHIFDSFTQVDGTNSRRFGGTGLGLAVSRELVELMGGDIGATSTFGEGSTFWFQVTMSKASDRQEQRYPVGASDSTLLSNNDLPQSLSVSSVEPLQSSPNILLAEDNAANQKVAITMLRMLGCQFDLADDGRKALLKWKAQSYDMILMDCQMPNLDGFAATAKIRNWEKQHQVASPIPIIAVTANALFTDRDRCLAAGMSDYISKPFRLADLKNGIERWLPENRSMVALESGPEPPTIGIPELDELRELGASTVDLEEIVHCYVETSATSVDAMASAIGSRNRESLKALAHQLKGGCGQVGAHEVASICFELNENANHAGWGELAGLFARLTQEIDESNEKLRATFGWSD